MAVRLIFLIIFISVHQLAAQHDFREGFIITPSKDTIRGVVNYRESARGNNFCEFKKNPSDNEIVTYTPNQLFGYGFKNDKFFLSREVLLPDSVKKLVFLEVLVEGRITLFMLKERNYFTLFFLEKGSEFYRINDGLPPKEEREVKKQLGILNYAMYDCPALHDRMASIEPDEASLVKITQKYNACMKEEGQSYQSSKPWVHFSPLVSVGGAYSMFEVVAKLDPEYEGKYNPSFGGVFGLGLDVTFPRLHERWALHLGYIFMPTEYSITTSTSTAISVNKYDINVKTNQSKFPFGLKYIFPVKKFHLFINGGGSFTTNKKEEVTNTVYRTYNHIEFSPIKGETHDILDRLLGSWIGVGSYIPVHKKIDLYTEIRYEATHGLFYIEGVMNSHLNNIFMVVGVKF